MRNEEIKEYLNANFQGVRAEMKADRDIFNLKLDSIIEHNERQDQRVEKIEERVEKNTNFRQKVLGVAALVSLFIGSAVSWIISHFKS